MPTRVTCPGCSKNYQAPDKARGRTLTCPGCGAKIAVPAPAEEETGFTLAPETARTPEPQRVSEPQRTARPSPPTPAGEVPREPDVKPGASAGERPRRLREAAAAPRLRSKSLPDWVQHLHWALVLALLPLVFSLLSSRADEIMERIEATIENAAEDQQEDLVAATDKLFDGDLSLAEYLRRLPERKLHGAMLARETWGHWALAFVSAGIFFTFFLLLATQSEAKATHILGIGLLTATCGVAVLLMFQWFADLSQGFYRLRFNVVALVLWIVKLIGLSYSLASDPNSGFLLSFLGFTVGVGLCEEVCKALPILGYVRGDSCNWRAAYICGLASGAGFGIAEGIMYSSQMYNGLLGFDIYLVRFLSCVALHAVWSGAAAISIQQNPDFLEGGLDWKEYPLRLAYVLGIPIVLHGLYDTLLKKDMNAYALGVAALSFLYLAFVTSRLHGGDESQATSELLKEYHRRRLVRP